MRGRSADSLRRIGQLNYHVRRTTTNQNIQQKHMNKLKATSLALALGLICSGCATYHTISETGPGRPKVYSGTRLDLNAMGRDENRVAKFKVAPPHYPVVDLPFSFLLDTMMLPLTFPVAAYEVIFDSKGM
jgi:uncharacterized protein YceK